METDSIIQNAINRWTDITKSNLANRQSTKTSYGWSSSNEEFLKNLGEKTMGFTWIYRYASNRYGDFHNLTTIMIIICSSLVATFSIFSTAAKDCNNLTWVGIINTVLGIIITTIGALQKFFNFDNISNQYEFIAKQYDNLNFDIRAVLTNKRRDRPPQKEIKEHFMTSFKSLRINSPELPDWASNKYYKISKTHHVKRPLDIEQIVIAKESQSRDSERKPKKHSSEGKFNLFKKNDVSDESKLKKMGNQITVLEDLTPKDDDATSSDEDSSGEIDNEFLNYELNRFSSQNINKNDTQEE